MEPKEKIIDFIYLDEFNSFVNKTDDFLGINFEQNKDLDFKVFQFLEGYFLERLSGPSLKGFAQKTLDFLSEEQINQLIDFVTQNFLNKREELWREAEKEAETSAETQEETFEEREKRYLETMKEIVKPAPSLEKKTQEPEKKVVTIEYAPEPATNETKEETIQIPKTITFQEEKEPELPEGTIIITKKESEEKKEKESEDFLDLSKL